MYAPCTAFHWLVDRKARELADNGMVYYYVIPATLVDLPFLINTSLTISIAILGQLRLREV